MVEVYAQGAVLNDPAIGEAGDVDTATVSARMANGALALIDNSRKAVYGYDQRVEVFGSGGLLQAFNNTPHNDFYANAEGVTSAKPLYFFLERYTESFIAEMRAFVESIQQDCPPPVTGADGRVPVLIAMAAKKSHDENRPVKLSEVG